MRKKHLSLFIVVLIVLLSLNTSFFNAKVRADDNCDKQCKIAEARRKQQELEKMMAEAKKEYDTFIALASEYAAELEKLEAEIDVLKPQIEELEIHIGELETSIKEKEELVAKLNERVLTRMKNAQPNMHFSPLLDFLMGSHGFADMIRRIYGIEAINNKEEKDRNELIDTIKALNEEKAELDIVKAELDEKMVDLEYKQEEARSKRNYFNEAAKEADEKVDNYRNQIDEQKSIQMSIQFNLDDLIGLSSLPNFSSPVPGASISAGFPYYPASFGGGVHLGVDYAVGLGQTLYAPADGVIIISDDNCPTYGNLGNSCGGAGGGVSYGGNQIYFMCSVNDRIYALTFSHLYSGSLRGTGVVLQGTPIARVGSSGNSTGPHCHIEMFYLGVGDNEDLADYINLIRTGRYSLSFNCGWGYAALANNCDTKGSAPCRLDGSLYLPG